MNQEISSLPESARPLVSQLAEEIGRHANAAMVYGTPVERGNVTVIPVARVRYGFGGGDHNRQDSGGGGGVSASPIGYVEITNSSTRFRPIFDPTTIAPIIAACGLAGMLLLKGLRKLTKAKQAEHH